MSMTIKEDYHASATPPLSSSSPSLTAMQQSASGSLDIGGGSDKGSIVFTIVELLLIALLLLCNCLNLVSVLGFGAP